MISRRGFLRATMAAAGMGLGAATYSWRVEPHWLQIVDRLLPIDSLPKGLIGTRLAHLSDIHVGLRVDDTYLIGAFERLKSLAPEFVVYTGDFTSHQRQRAAHGAERHLAYSPLTSSRLRWQLYF